MVDEPATGRGDGDREGEGDSQARSESGTPGKAEAGGPVLRGFYVKTPGEAESRKILAYLKQGELYDPRGEALGLKIGINEDGVLVAPI